MKSFFIIIVLLLSTVLVGENKWQKDVFDNVVTVETRIEGDRIVFKMSAETLGWISIGFEPTKVMKNADIFIGYVKGDEVFLEDHYAKGLTSHKSDESLGGTNDLIVIDGYEEGNVTTIIFSIPLESKDKFDKPLKAGGTYKLIYAIGKKDNIRTFHYDRGIGELTIPVKAVE